MAATVSPCWVGWNFLHSLRLLFVFVFVFFNTFLLVRSIQSVRLSWKQQVDNISSSSSSSRDLPDDIDYDSSSFSSSSFVSCHNRPTDRPTDLTDLTCFLMGAVAGGRAADAERFLSSLFFSFLNLKRPRSGSSGSSSSSSSWCCGECRWADEKGKEKRRKEKKTSLYFRKKRIKKNNSPPPPPPRRRSRHRLIRPHAHTRTHTWERDRWMDDGATQCCCCCQLK